MSVNNYSQGYYSTTYKEVDKVLNDRMLRIGNLVVFLGDSMNDRHDGLSLDIDKCVSNL